jgi:hypothetical protein
MSSGVSPMDYGYREPSQYELALEQQRLARNMSVKLLAEQLKNSFITNRFMSHFIKILEGDLPLDKRFAIAKALDAVMENQDLSSQTVRANIVKEVLTDVYDSRSALYSALNTQSALPLTLNGPAQVFAFNYARTLQNVHLLARNDPARSHVRISKKN